MGRTAGDSPQTCGTPAALLYSKSFLVLPFSRLPEGRSRIDVWSQLFVSFPDSQGQSERRNKTSSSSGSNEGGREVMPLPENPQQQSVSE